MKYYFIINPLAGSGDDTQSLLKQIEEYKNNYDLNVYYTKCEQDATKFVSETCSKEKEDICFVACGGDGTINEVVSGAIGHDNAHFSVYPAGSGNDFVKCFEKGAFKNIKNILEGTVMPIDVIKANNRYCINIANFGFDTTVAKTVNDDRKLNGHGNKNSYAKGVMRAFIFSMKNVADVYADGELLNKNGNYLLCTIGNGQYVGGSFHCSPRAILDDGYLEVCLVKCITKLRFMTLIGSYTKGTHLDGEKNKKIIAYKRAKQVKVIAPKGLTYTLDGEIFSNQELNISVLPKAIKLIAPGKPLYEEK